MECPCENCIVKVMCSNRRIEELINHCHLVKEFSGFELPAPGCNSEDYYIQNNYIRENLHQLYLTLKPTRWSISGLD